MTNETNPRGTSMVIDVKTLRDTLQGILDADYRKWEELASPEEFVKWAKARARHALAATAETAPDAGTDGMQVGWLVENGKQGDDLRYRTWKDGMPTWTADHNEATRYCRRIDAERAHQEDEDAWRIVEHAWHNAAHPSPKESAPALQRFDHVYQGDCPDERQPESRDENCPACMAQPAPAVQEPELRMKRIGDNIAIYPASPAVSVSELPPLPRCTWPSGFYGALGEDGYTATQMREYALAARHAPTAPEGWKLVPIEPTDEMIEAAHQGDVEYTERNFGDVMVVAQSGYDHWKAMIAAAPLPKEETK